MTYNKSMVFIETTLFTKLIYEYLDDEEYRELQQYLMLYPDAGKIIRGSRGIRKIRWSIEGKGKSGGVRTIYYWAKEDDQIFMLTIYSKSEKENISVEALNKIVKQLEAMK